MADNTPTFDLDREDPGADGWTDRINGNFTDIETLLTGGSVNGENPSPNVDNIENAVYNNRPLWSTQDRTIVYGTDVTTPTELIGEIPYILSHNYEIDVSGVSDTTLDLRIPQTLSTTVGDDTTEGVSIRVVGSASGIGGPDIGSFYVEGFVGGLCQLVGVTVNKQNPFDDEGTAIVAKNSRVDLVRTDVGSAITAGTNGYSAFAEVYAGKVELREIDIGANLVDYGGICKKMGVLKEQSNVTTPAQGTADEYAYWPQSGKIETYSDGSTISGVNGYSQLAGGQLYDIESGTNFSRVYGAEIQTKGFVPQDVTTSVEVTGETIGLNGANGNPQTVTTISGGEDGDTITLVNRTETITLDHGADNIFLDSGVDLALDDFGETVSLVRAGNGNWYETGRATR